MIPQEPTEPQFELPLNVRPPQDGEAGEDGFGGFRDTWFIPPGWERADAQSFVNLERRLVAVVDRVSVTQEDFDLLASIVEMLDPLDDTPFEGEYAGLSAPVQGALQRLLEVEGELPLDLELGVGGLVAALSSSGFYTAASCRGHPSGNAWADRPTVFFAGERNRVALLEPAVMAAGASLGDGSSNASGLVVLHAPSVAASMRLAEAILGLGLNVVGCGVAD